MNRLGFKVCVIRGELDRQSWSPALAQIPTWGIPGASIRRESLMLTTHEDTHVQTSRDERMLSAREHRVAQHAPLQLCHLLCHRMACLPQSSGLCIRTAENRRRRSC
eukprot:282692-Amphidinium_carterae.1